MPFCGSARLKDARNMHVSVIEQTARKAQNNGKGGEPAMNKLVARLIDCGMTRPVALCVLRRFPDLKTAERYVEEIEEASREQMEVLKQ